MRTNIVKVELPKDISGTDDVYKMESDPSKIVLTYNNAPSLEFNNHYNALQLFYNKENLDLRVFCDSKKIIVHFNDGHNILIKNNIFNYSYKKRSVALEKLNEKSNYYNFVKKLENNVSAKSYKILTDPTYEYNFIGFKTFRKAEPVDKEFEEGATGKFFYSKTNKVTFGFTKTSKSVSYSITNIKGESKTLMEVFDDYVFYDLYGFTCVYYTKSNKLMFKLGDFLFFVNDDNKLNISLKVKSENNFLKQKENNLGTEFNTKFIIDEDMFVSLEVRNNDKKLIHSISPITMNNLDETNNDIFDDLDPNKDAEKVLAKLVGLKSVKDSVDRIKAYTLKNNNRMINLHMAFLGNPGTGKTMVAKLMAKILYKNRVLPTDSCHIVTRYDLVEQFIGQTAIKTKELINKAMGGILFVDEAYSLASANNRENGDFGIEAIDTLLKELEDKKGKFCCILAGYENDMEKLFKMNPGFVSRIQFHLHFEDYNMNELSSILDIELAKRKLNVDDYIRNKLINVIKLTKDKLPNFANGRDVRNIVEQIYLYSTDRDDFDFDIKEDDILSYMSDNSLSETTIKDYDMFKNSKLQAYYKNRYIPKLFEKNINNVFETIIGITLDYSNETFIRTGFIFTGDGYALTYGNDTKTSIKAKAVRHIYDYHDNIIETEHEVYSVFDYEKLSVIKLKNYGSTFEYLPLDDSVNIKDYIGKKLLVVGTSYEKSYNNNGYDTSYIVINNFYDDLSFSFKTLEDENYHIGSAIIDPETCKVLGIVINENLAMPINKIIEIIKQNE